MPRRKQLDVCSVSESVKWPRQWIYWLAWATKEGATLASQIQSGMTPFAWYVTNITSYVWPSYIMQSFTSVSSRFLFFFFWHTNIIKREKKVLEWLNLIPFRYITAQVDHQHIRGLDSDTLFNGYPQSLYRRAFTRFLLSDFWSGYRKVQCEADPCRSPNCRLSRQIGDEHKQPSERATLSLRDDFWQSE